MPKRSYKQEEIAAKLRQVDVLHSQGTTLADLTGFRYCMRWMHWSRKTHSSSGPTNTAGPSCDAWSWGSTNGNGGLVIPSLEPSGRLSWARLALLEIGFRHRFPCRSRLRALVGRRSVPSSFWRVRGRGPHGGDAVSIEHDRRVRRFISYLGRRC